MAEAVRQVPHCALRTAYDQTMVKLEMRAEDLATRALLSRALLAMGARELLGQAPVGALEDVLQRAVVGDSGREPRGCVVRPAGGCGCVHIRGLPRAYDEQGNLIPLAGVAARSARARHSRRLPLGGGCVGHRPPR